jgi:hypothetical protein
MPAEIVNAEFCADYWATYEVLSSDGKTKYTVTFAGGEGGAHCTCKGFAYRKDCRHISEVFKKGCFWNPQWYDGGSREIKPTNYIDEDHHISTRCPKCGGPTVPVRIAV